MRYVVVKDEAPYRFSKFHDNFEKAKVEAERLCQKEQTPFILLEVVGSAYIENPLPPVKWNWENLRE